MVLVLVCFYGNAQTHKAQMIKDDQKSSRPIVNPPIEQMDGPKPQAKSEQHVQADVRGIEIPTKDRYDKASFWVSTVLALSGILGIGVALGSLKAIKRQAEIMERQANEAKAAGAESLKIAVAAAEAAQKSASAALLNAQAFINAERPWILAIVKSVDGPIGGFNVYVRNKGRTPALITGVFLGCVIINQMGELPEPPTYGPGNVHKDRIIVPGQLARVHWFDETIFKHMLNDQLPLDDHSVVRFVFGKITYRDLANPDKSLIHETRWIGMYQPPFGDEEGNTIFRMEGIGVSENYEGYR